MKEKRLSIPETPLQHDQRDGLFDEGSIFFIGTATVLIGYAGLVIMTDPNFLHKGDHVHLGYGIHSMRVTDPAIELEHLPHVDLIVLSHFHEDHFDKLVQKKLDRSIPIVSTQHAVDALSKLGFQNLVALDTWQSVVVSKGPVTAKITSMPGQHMSGMLGSLQMLPPVMGSIIEFFKSAPSNTLLSLEGGIDHLKLLFRMYISGDTVMYKELSKIPKIYPHGSIDLGLFHLGGTTLLGMVMVTMDHKQGVEAIRLIRPNRAIPIHYNDYTVFKSPLDDFKREVEQDPELRDIVTYLSHGETYVFRVNETRH